MVVRVLLGGHAEDAPAHALSHAGEHGHVPARPVVAVVQHSDVQQHREGQGGGQGPEEERDDVAEVELLESFPGLVVVDSDVVLRHETDWQEEGGAHCPDVLGPVSLQDPPHGHQVEDQVVAEKGGQGPPAVAGEGGQQEYPDGSIVEEEEESLEGVPDPGDDGLATHFPEVVVHAGEADVEQGNGEHAKLDVKMGI